MLVRYLVKREDEEAQLQREEDFKNMVFANNPEMYFKLWPPEEQVDEDGIEEIVPETPEDIAKMIKEFQRWAGGA